ncbi:DsbA family oxidoreductase [Pseudoclavibacter chungangensis]|uniref:DsbA family oxidoreductase n=1 Tax=Pseudoclavibacter chungangensis TaxID=587635 RepID=A0A7J5C1D2_9MICO|nr:DsbA family oxidoreductase [Pseudoclavibacter chungangensis]KAB1662414.1 DsbA family oxidoreductase [Pseudoclavibacter chungangensis]
MGDGVRIEIWADVVCPWCGIMNERLNRALARFGHDDEVEVVHHAFRLSPELPEDHGFAVTERMTANGRMSEADAVAASTRIEDIAHEDGIERYHVADGSTGNTMRMLEVLAFAASRGIDRAAWDAAFHAHFGTRRDIWNPEALADFADSIGVNGDEALFALHTRRFAEQIEADQARAVALGAQGVPFVVVDGRYGISGVQSVDTLVDVFERALAAEDDIEAVSA